MTTQASAAVLLALHLYSQLRRASGLVLTGNPEVTPPKLKRPRPECRMIDVNVGSIARLRLGGRPPPSVLEFTFGPDSIPHHARYDASSR
jgi:hypothetical protein